MATQPLSHFEPEEYLRRERLAATKHEYLEGEVIAMAGGSREHVRISANLIFSLMSRTRGTSCEVFGSDLRLYVEWGKFFAYPDVSVVCGEPSHLDGQRDTITNPRVLVEVLSPTTRNYDRGDKSLRYRMLPSLAEYLLVEQQPVDIELYRHQADGSWGVWRILDPNAAIRLESINVDLPVSEIYAGVVAL